MGIQWIILPITCIVFVRATTTEQGNECSINKDCRQYQFCYNNSCKCADGYVKYMEECYPVKAYGQKCSHDIQCNDYRMICTNYENDVQQPMFCYCDPYHLWNQTIKSCLEIGNISQMVGNFREVYNVTGLLEKSAQKVFLGVVIAGLVSVSVLLSFIGICSVYGCCENRKKGRYGEEDYGNDQVNEVAIIGLPEGSYEAIDTDFSGMAM